MMYAGAQAVFLLRLKIIRKIIRGYEVLYTTVDGTGKLRRFYGATWTRCPEKSSILLVSATSWSVRSRACSAPVCMSGRNESGRRDIAPVCQASLRH